ncbi:C10orf107 [Bugula neritina]|uniref:C10orf107 n=1 Tax=Bugula neritina TaxID=10212 RepID=A0A7J7IWP2_BUGNE|nr:C10orf107 [Bugula neritina]
MADIDKRKGSLTQSSMKKRSGKSNKTKDKENKAGDETDRENPYVFKVIDETQTKNLLEQEVEEVEKSLASILQLENHSTELLEATQLDYYVSVFWWAKEQQFSVPQTSALFTAANQLLLNIKEKHMHILDNIRELKMMMSGVGAVETETPGGLDIFDSTQAKKIADYFHTTLLQHYKLYQFVFSHTQAEEIIGLDLTCELVQPADVPYPPPLAEGLPGDVWEKYVKTPPPTPLPTQESESELQARKEEAEEAKRQARLKQEEEIAQQDLILSKLTPEEIQQVVELVTKDTFKNLNAEMASRLRERENTILSRINKVHKVAST